MNDMRALGLVDSTGRPLPAHIEGVLTRLLPRLRRQFPMLQDDTSLVEVVEEAGRRLCAREGRGGPIEKLHGYAWVTLRSVATSHMRRGSIRLIQSTLEPEASREQIASVPAECGSATRIERDILLREALDTLTPEEKLVCIWKKAGFSSQEIAKFRGRSVVAVDTLFSRAKQKVRSALGIARPKANGRSLDSAGTEGSSRGTGDADTETRDGRTWAPADGRRTAGCG
jgi:RNA polymerase sigma factor (sigma-70 family)